MHNVAKRLRFPLLGVAKNLSCQDTTFPTENREYATPMALNVIGSCVFKGRTRGGSRPGLKKVNGVVETNGGRWLWPNGEPIQWPDGKTMAFSDFGDTVTMPDGTRVFEQHRAFTIYRDRLIKSEGALWMASRTGEYGDFDFGADGGDESRAAAGNIALAGRKGEDITCFAPVNDRVMFIATRRAIRMVQGEPTAAVQPVSDSVGVISRNAWCFDGMRVWFIGPNGLYAMAPGESPVYASPQLPEDLKGWTDATLVYDPENRAIHIFGETDWYYDMDAKAFWPLAYNPLLRPTGGGVAVIGGVNKVVLRANDEWYHWDDDTSKDGGLYDIESHVAVGPFRCGTRDDTDGMLDAMTVTLAAESSEVDVNIAASHSAEGAVGRIVEEVNPSFDASFAAGGGWNHVSRPRVRGSWAVVVISSTGRWAYESILANIKTLGRLRP